MGGGAVWMKVTCHNQPTIHKCYNSGQWEGCESSKFNHSRYFIFNIYVDPLDFPYGHFHGNCGKLSK